MVSSILESTPLVLSIDLHLTQGHRDLTDLRKLNDFTRSLLEALAKNQLVATFGLDDPGHSQLAELILNQGNHEIAILADDCWASSGINKTVFANELSRRIESAERQGIQVRSLFLPTTPTEQKWSSIRENKVIAVRTGRLRKPAFSPSLGVWDIAISTIYPASNAWLPGLLKPSISAVLSTGKHLQPLHLQINAEAVIRNGQMIELQIQNLLKQCHDLKARNEVRLCVLSELAYLLDQNQPLDASQSVRKAS